MAAVRSNEPSGNGRSLPVLDGERGVLQAVLGAQTLGDVDQDVGRVDARDVPAWSDPAREVAGHDAGAAADFQHALPGQVAERVEVRLPDRGLLRVAPA